MEEEIKQRDRSMERRMNRPTDGHTYGKMENQTDGKRGKWTEIYNNGHVDRCTYGQTDVQMYICTY